MWRVAAFVDGAWVEITPIALEGEPPSSAATRDAALKGLPDVPTTLREYLDREIEAATGTSPFPGSRDAIVRWSAAAEAEAREFDWAGAAKIEAVEEALGLFPRDADTPQARATTLAWHDRTTVIIPLPATEQDLVVEYVAELRDENAIERLRFRHASPDHMLETILDWRGYFGRESAVIDGWTTMRRRGHGYVASLRGTAGFVVASVLRRLTRPQPTLDRDPTATRRLVAMCERYPRIAAGCRDLRRTPAAQTDCAVVFIHGTVSCGIQALKDLFPGAVPVPISPPVFRYEHDTFRPVTENGRELADLITTHVRASRVLLAGHSRGGLVGRVALESLARSGYPAAVELYTFGTPHGGTPLAAMGGKALNLLFKLGEDLLGAIPMLTPLTKAYSYLYDSPVLPPGIEVMREDSEPLALLNQLGDPRAVRSWASRFDIATGVSGFGVEVEGALLGAMHGIPNDLVVPAASALAFGNAQPLLACSHLNYFREPVIQAAIQNYCAPAAAAPAAPAAAGVRAPAPAGSGIHVAEDHVIIGGIRVPRRKP